MKVYRPRASWMDDERLNIPSMTVHVQEGARNTGLLDSSGTPLIAFDEVGPIGFVTNFSVPAKMKPKKRK